VLHVMLFRLWNMFFTFTLTLSVVCVQCPLWPFFVVHHHHHHHHHCNQKKGEIIIIAIRKKGKSSLQSEKRGMTVICN
jgi:hypothetical protein